MLLYNLQFVPGRLGLLQNAKAVRKAQHTLVKGHFGSWFDCIGDRDFVDLGDKQFVEVELRRQASVLAFLRGRVCAVVRVAGTEQTGEAVLRNIFAFAFHTRQSLKNVVLADMAAAQDGTQMMKQGKTARMESHNRCMLKYVAFGNGNSWHLLETVLTMKGGDEYKDCIKVAVEPFRDLGRLFRNGHDGVVEAKEGSGVRVWVRVLGWYSDNKALREVLRHSTGDAKLWDKPIVSSSAGGEEMKKLFSDAGGLVGASLQKHSQLRDSVYLFLAITHTDAKLKKIRENYRNQAAQAKTDHGVCIDRKALLEEWQVDATNACTGPFHVFATVGKHVFFDIEETLRDIFPASPHSTFA